MENIFSERLMMFGLIQNELTLTGLANDFTEFQSWDALQTYLKNTGNSAPKVYFRRTISPQEFDILPINLPVLVLLNGDAYGQKSYYFIVKGATNPIRG